MFTRLLCIAIGGAIGSLARYGTTVGLKPWSSTFPAGTLIVNLLGCFLIGLLQGVLVERWAVREEVRLALGVGLLGGYTTFSTFALDTALLSSRGEQGRAVLNVLASTIAGVALVFAGFYISRIRP